ncbi:MAG: hypothetical protein Q9214_001858, partial [Letrouitia sp. 1 TL-2023]
MGGMLQNASQHPSSAKKQQSISSFFTKPSKDSKSIPSNDQTALSNLDVNSQANSLFLPAEDDEDDDILPATRRRSRTPKRGPESDQHEPERLEGSQKKRLRLSNGAESELLTSQSPQELSPKLTKISANQVRRPNNVERTSKYIFSSSPTQDENIIDDDEAKSRKEVLHQRFVKKLGRPDSIAEIKRRNWQLAQEETQVEGDEAEEPEEDEAQKPAARGKKSVAAKKGNSKLTPMEKQFLEIKRSHMDTLLIVEVGYKFKFFGEDARTAAKELSIVCIPGKFRYDEHPSEAHLDRFASASIPVHRLHVHVKRLVGAGHKVGFVRQIETAALKAAGDNRNAPFVRKLTNVYTKGTYIDDVDGAEGPVNGPSGGTTATGYLVCLTENNAKGWGTDEKVQVGLIAVQPATGDVIYDDFEDGFMRSEIETRLLHIAPCEIMIVGNLSKATDKIVQHLSGSKTTVFGEKVRVERVEKPKTMTAQAYSHVSNFYAGKMKASDASQDEKASRMLDK